MRRERILRRTLTLSSHLIFVSFIFKVVVIVLSYEDDTNHKTGFEFFIEMRTPLYLAPR